MTYSWSLSWANVDTAFYVEQETKAGFWNKDIQVFLINNIFEDFACLQVIYDSLFPDNPRAIRSLDIEDWDAFCSPWAHDKFLKKITSIKKFLFCSGRMKKSFDTP